MNSYETIFTALAKIAGGFSLSQPEDLSHGDFATNIAFMVGKEKGMSPKQAADELVASLLEDLSEIVEKVEVAGPGFINFFLKDDVRTDEAEAVALSDVQNIKGKGKVIVEYTDPNPFKLFHIGHIVPNTIGESIARIYESAGYDVARICYQGDVGMHVAKAVWWLTKFPEELPADDATLSEKVELLGKAYATGTQMLADDESLKAEINEINKKIFTRSDEEINRVYDMGRKWSLDYFDMLYEKLGTKFDHYIFESEVADEGVRIVKENIGNVFEESEGAIVFKGEDVGLHTRVFINSQGLPTYEAKELGNTYKKEELVPGAVQSVVVTGKEIDEYFKVMKAVIEKIDKPLGDRLLHVSHGMLRLPDGKMSSRKGTIIPAEELIELVKEQLRGQRYSEMDKDEHNLDLSRSGSTPDRLKDDKLANDVAVGAIKFSILKSTPGKDMVFDFDKSISFEGDSGPYLQYTHARICALLDKAHDAGIDIESYVIENPERELEGAIIGYSQVLEKAFKDLGPHHIVQHLLLLTRAFNNMYGRVQIVGEDKEKSAYYVMLSHAVKNILAHGLYTLGIIAPSRM